MYQLLFYEEHTNMLTMSESQEEYVKLKMKKYTLLHCLRTMCKSSNNTPSASAKNTWKLYPVLRCLQLYTITY